MKSLTDKQKQVFDFIVNNLNEMGCPPTRAEISKSIGCRSPNSADLHLRAIEKKGFVKLYQGISRGIKIIEQEEV